MNDSVVLAETTFEIGMPQMTMKGLSENWLFKKIGASHWSLIAEAFNTPSSRMVDEEGNRLYASFVRITVEGSGSLEQVKENDTCCIDGSIKRFGTNMLFSKVLLVHDMVSFNCNLITMFSSRKQENDNNLQKSTISSKIEGIESVRETPEHAMEYRLLKKGMIGNIELSGYVFSLSDEVVFSTVYAINPYYDVNGLNLLYFASYPTISDFAESKYFTTLPGMESWVNEFYTQSRDVFYYANCNPTQNIIYLLHYYEFVNKDLVKIHSSLVRETDNEVMAKVFTIKRRYN